LAQREITLVDVEQELGRRFGISGLDEKASRQVAEAIDLTAQKPASDLPS
jgi:hypothetical protein